MLGAWGLTSARPLAGGQGRAFAGGGLVLKPVDDVAAAGWLAGVLAALPDDPDVRVIRPVASSHDGAWVVEGWAAWAWLDGVPAPSRVGDVLAVSAAFHRLVAHVGPPPPTDDPWSLGHRFAWDGLDLPQVPAGLADDVRARLRPVGDRPARLLHGDLLGNVLFHDDLAPAVIDVSPTWGPVGYADAIVVVDAVQWWDGDPALLRLVDEQLVLRAALFRLGAACVLLDGSPRLAKELDAFAAVAQALR